MLSEQLEDVLSDLNGIDLSDREALWQLLSQVMRLTQITTALALEVRSMKQGKTV